MHAQLLRLHLLLVAADLAVVFLAALPNAARLTHDRIGRASEQYRAAFLGPHEEGAED
jgi:hypothetical protein